MSDDEFQNLQAETEREKRLWHAYRTRADEQFNRFMELDAKVIAEIARRSIESQVMDILKQAQPSGGTSPREPSTT